MDRRRVLRLLAVVGAAGGAMGHSPYRQWQVYRQSRLIVVTTAADPASYPLGEAVAAVLARHVPESRALAARTADAVEAVRLLSSRQLDLALLGADDAREALEGRGRFDAEGPLPLRALAVLGRYLLVCRDDFPADRALAVSRALAEHWRGGGGLPAASAATRALIPAHPGVVGQRP